MVDAEESLKQKAVELEKISKLTNEQIDFANEELNAQRYADVSLISQISSKILICAEANEYDRGRANALRNLAWIHLRTDKNHEAVKLLNQSRDFFLKSNDDLGLAQVANNLAVVNGKLGEFETAIESYAEAKRLYEKAQNQIGVASVLINLGGYYYHRLGSYAVALDYYYQALKTAVTLGQPLYQAQTYMGLGDILWRINETGQSIEYLQQSLGFFKKNRDDRNQAGTLVNLGAANYAQQEYNQALEHLDSGLQAAIKAGCQEIAAEAHNYMASIYYEKKDLQSSIVHLVEAAESSQNIDDWLNKSQSLLQLGLIYQQIGDYQKSIELFLEVLTISEEFNAEIMQFKAHFALSKIYQDKNKATEALKHFQKFHQISERISDPQAIKKIQYILLQNELKTGFTPSPRQKSSTKTAAKTISYSNAGLTPQKLRKVIGYISENLAQSIIISELAEKIDLSQRHFQRAFKKSTGKTPHQYIVEQRVGRAKHLLLSTTLPLSEIALRCGFSNQSHLTAHFRLITGTTPRRFR